MPAHGQRRNQNNISSGEEFDDITSSLTDDDESVQLEDDWIFPVVRHKADRKEYEEASKSHCRIY
jgi:hypothetical protein